ncbi:MAG: glycosyltransferase, partial [Bifidobacterium sp.]|nr:glycosyltransferase [Bifidobacterium sp.]
MARHLPTCLDSLLSREGDDLEVIVVDDGSTDDTAQVV